MKNTKTKKGMSAGKKVVIGAGVAALSAATAGAYYLMGPNSKAHQKKAKDLMGKMKKEVVMQAKKAKAVSAPLYHKAVDSVVTTYAKQYKMHEGDIKAIAKKLKGEWKAAGKTVKKTAKKAVKKLTKVSKK